MKSPSSSSWVNSPLTESNDDIILPAVTVTNMRGGSGSQELDSGLATPSLTSNDSSSRLVSAANITVTPDTASMTSVDSNGSVAYGSRRRPSRSLDDCVVFTRSGKSPFLHVFLCQWYGRHFHREGAGRGEDNNTRPPYSLVSHFWTGRDLGNLFYFFIFNLEGYAALIIVLKRKLCVI